MRAESGIKRRFLRKLSWTKDLALNEVVEVALLALL
jgi:hypothetical protein